MTKFNNMLVAACSVCNCSPKQALSRDRQQKCVFARFIFFALATEDNYRDYHAAWFLGRHRATAYHYRRQINALCEFDKHFNNLLAKAKDKYAKLC